MQERIRICQVSSVHKTFDTRIYYKICKSLSKKYDVYYVSANAKNEVRDGIHIVGVNLPKSRLKRQLQLGKVYKTLVAINAEIYQFHDPELISIGLKIKKIGKKVIFDSHEDVPQQILDKDYLPFLLRRIISAIYSFYENIKLKQYDILISVTPTIVERLQKINPQTYQITNYPIAEKRGGEDKRTFDNNICFFGGVTDLWCQRQIIQSLVGLDSKYLFAGPLDNDNYIDGLKREEGYSQATYLGVISHSECIDLMKTCSAGMALSDYTGNMGGHRGTLGNNKLFEYMQAGIPVIATDFDLWKDIIERYECGVIVNPHNIEAIHNAVNFLTSHPEDAKRMGDNGVKAVELEFNWSTQEEILLKIYQSLF